MEQLPKKIEKPELVYKTRKGQWGELVVELESDSERAWSSYITAQNMARIALSKAEIETEEQQLTKF